MSTFERQPLTQLSTNTLSRPQTELAKVKLPHISNILSLNTSTLNSTKTTPTKHKLPALDNNTSVKKPLITKINTERLKLSLKLAHYKVRTNQESVPFKEILKNHTYSLELKLQELEARKKERKQNQRTLVAPTPNTLALLAASTPLKSKSPKFSQSSSKKKVSFIKSKSFHGSTSSSKSMKLSNTAEANIIKKPQQVIKNDIKLEDMFHGAVNTLIVTPVKAKNHSHQEDIMSSPTKKGESTPIRYAAAKSLLDFASLV